MRRLLLSAALLVAAVACGPTATDNYCSACATNADCGGGSNMCLGFTHGSFCGLDCTNGGGCPANALCQDVPGTTLKSCVPAAGFSCTSSGTGGGTGGGVTGGGSGGGVTGGGSGGGVTGGGSGGGVTGGGSGGGVTGGGSGGGGGTACTTDTWASYGSGFFASNCTTGCHNHREDMTRQSGVQAGASTISGKISGGSMPPGGLSGTEKTRILKYLSCGAP